MLGETLHATNVQCETIHHGRDRLGYSHHSYDVSSVDRAWYWCPINCLYMKCFEHHAPLSNVNPGSHNPVQAYPVLCHHPGKIEDDRSVIFHHLTWVSKKGFCVLIPYWGGLLYMVPCKNQQLMLNPWGWLTLSGDEWRRQHHDCGRDAWRHGIGVLFLWWFLPYYLYISQLISVQKLSWLTCCFSFFLTASLFIDQRSKHPLVDVFFRLTPSFIGVSIIHELGIPFFTNHYHGITFRV